MHRNIFICAVTLAAIIYIGCGADKVIGSPEKSVLAYVETITTGESPNMAEAGFTEADNKNLGNILVKAFAESFTGVIPLNEETLAELGKTFHAHCKANMTFQAKLKTSDGNPVVELTTTPLDMDTATKMATSNDELIALFGMVGKLKAEGATDEQLLNNSDVQKLAVSALGKYIESIPVKEEKTIDIPCAKIDGSDGNTHWAPAKVPALTDFVMGKK